MPHPETIPETGPDARARAVDAAAALFGVAVRPEWRAAVLANFATVAAAAAFVAEAPLDDEAEYGPVFCPASLPAFPPAFRP